MIYPILLSELYREHKEDYMKAFSEFFDRGIFIGGPDVEDFEKNMADYLHAEYVVGCGNGTEALELAMRASSIGQGDHVITTANTYYATARAIHNVGAVPLFCDVDEDGLIAVDKIESLIDNKTRAVLPVHLYGISADLDKIRRICEKYGILCIEDCAHAFGSSYHHDKIGSHSYCACFSLYPTKNLGAFGDAGMVATNSGELAARMRELRYYTSDPDRVIFHKDGMHTRLDPLQACLLNTSIKYVDAWNSIRRKHCEYYIGQFKGRVPYIKKMENPDVIPYVFPIIADDQQKFYDYLMNNGICPQIHYKPDLHKIDHLLFWDKSDQKDEYRLPMTEYLNSHVVSIPVSPTVTDDEIRYIAGIVLQYFGE